MFHETDCKNTKLTQEAVFERGYEYYTFLQKTSYS